jgi:hypothetical protein
MNRDASERVDEPERGRYQHLPRSVENVLDE